MINLLLEDISFSYQEEEKALDHISFSLTEDDFLCVFGASGSGKTTLLKVIAGLLIQDEGNVFIHNELQNAIPAYKRKIGYVFQEPKLYPHLTVYENLMLGIKHMKLSFVEKDNLIKKLMKTFHLLPFMNIKPKYLSLGEQEKVALAKVFLVPEDVYLLDEAMSGLDALSRKKVLKYIKRIKEENHAPMIYVSHDEENVPSFATKVLILKEGKVLFFNTLEEMNHHPTHIDVLHYFNEHYNQLSIKVMNHKMFYQEQEIGDSTLPNDTYYLCLPLTNFYVDNNDGISLMMKKTYLDQKGRLILEGYSSTHQILIPLTLEDEDKINDPHLYFNFHLQKGFVFKEDGTLAETL